ncbi:MAG: threonine/serine exporter family protein [Clostridiales bacterium]|nr:threonine/serine exporter family protein [Clostridiales bacterium]
MNSADCELFLEDVLHLGRQFLQTGAEVKRVEDTIKRICSAYDFKNPEIYATTSLIVVTIKSKSGGHYTQSARITNNSTDLGQLEELNSKARYICESTPDLKEFNRLIRDVKRSQPKSFIKCLGYILAAGGFTLFFGGNLTDGLASAVISIAIYFMDYNLKLRNVNSAVYTFIASLVSGCIAALFVHFGFGTNIDKVMAGDIMILIPGLLLVNSIKEMFNKDIVTGLYRLVEAVFVAAALAGGYALALIIAGGLGL